MTRFMLEVGDWAEQQFGTCDLGDKRRTRRAVKMASQFAANPDGSTQADGVLGRLRSGLPIV
jgi:hypothetical protein